VRAAPLRLSPDRVWLYGAACAIVTSLPFILFGWFRDAAYHGDLGVFWSAGANAGTAALADSIRLGAWQAARHISAQPFLYLPAFAWLYAPLSHLSPMTALVIEEIAMAALFGAAGLVAARAYGVSRWFAIVAVFAWGPAVNAIEVGQNTGLALLLAFWMTSALVNRRAIPAGLSVGLLLYKPTVAIPFVLLLIARKQWKALAVVLACAGCWYLASVQAAGGDWLWPAAYAHTMAAWFPIDFHGAAVRAYTLPSLLMSLGMNRTVAVCVGAAGLVLALSLLARVSALEAASIAPLIGLAFSPHAWPYEAALALPAIFYAMVTVREPWRTRLIAGVYVLGAAAMILPHGAWLLAFLVLGGTGVWVASAVNRSSKRIATTSGALGTP
jgi:hypothetical protein